MKNVLLVKTGDAANPVRLRVGDYDHWFALSVRADGCGLHLVSTHSGARLPSRPQVYDGIWVTGSPHSVTAGATWMRRTADYLREASERNVPILGVCFGHQLLA